jgi:hypothetical protein
MSFSAIPLTNHIFDLSCTSHEMMISLRDRNPVNGETITKEAVVVGARTQWGSKYQYYGGRHDVWRDGLVTDGVHHHDDV